MARTKITKRTPIGTIEKPRKIGNLSSSSYLSKVECNFISVIFAYTPPPNAPKKTTPDAIYI